MTPGEIAAITLMVAVSGWAIYRILYGYPAPTYMEEMIAREEKIIAACGCIAYCPGCRDPLNDQATWVEDDEGRGAYGCTKCGRQSEWHFGIAPVPILLKPTVVRGGA